MNYAVFRVSDGAIVSYGYCQILEQVLGHATDGLDVVEVHCDVSAETHRIENGEPVPITPVS